MLAFITGRAVAHRASIACIASIASIASLAGISCHSSIASIASNVVLVLLARLALLASIKSILLPLGLRGEAVYQRPLALLRVVRGPPPGLGRVCGFG